MNYQKICQQILDHFEITLRKFISTNLKKHYGSDWWSTQVPKGVKSRIDKENKSKSSNNKNIIELTHIGEIKDIIVFKKNRNVFKRKCGLDINKIANVLEEIVLIRNPVRHTRSIVDREKYKKLLACTRNIYDAIGEKLPFINFDQDKYAKLLVSKFENIEKLFIPRSIYLDEPKKEIELIQSMSLANVISENNLIILIGGPGSGKSTYLSYIAYEYARSYLNTKDVIDNGNNYIPILIPLGLYDSHKGGLINLIHDFLPHEEYEIIAEELEQVLSEYDNLIFLFDGLNEIPAKEIHKAIRELNRFMEANDHLKFVYSSREFGHERIFENAKTVVLEEIFEQEIKNYFYKYFDHLNKDKSKVSDFFESIDSNFLEMIKSPLLSNLCVRVLAEGNRLDVLSKTSLFCEFVNNILKREMSKATQEKFPSDFEIRLFLTEIAYKMMEEMNYTINQEQFEYEVEKIWEKLREEGRISCSEAEIMNSLEKIGLLDKGRDKFYFIHSQFQEYFASRKLTKLYSKEQGSSFDKLLNFRWNGVSEFALESTDNVERLIRYALKNENYYLIGRCLSGHGGKKAEEEAKKIAEELSAVKDIENRIKAVKILGAGRNAYYSFKKLLEIMTQEEEYLNVKYEEKGYSLWHEEWDCKLTILATSYDDKNLEKEIDQSLKDFVVFKEVEFYLTKLRSANNIEFLNLTEEIDKYSISARGYATEILGRIRVPGKENAVIRFLETRLDRTIEPSIEVRTAAYQCLDKWHRKEPQNERIQYLLNKESIIEAVSGDYAGFFYDERIVPGWKLPPWRWDIVDKVEKSGIQESEIDKFLEITKYIIKQRSVRHPFGDEEQFFSKLNIDVKKRKGLKCRLWYFEEFSELIFCFKIIEATAIHRGPSAVKGFKKYIDDQNILVALFAIFGLNIMNYAGTAKGRLNNQQIALKTSEVLDKFFKIHKKEAIPILLQLGELKLEKFSPFVKFNEVLKNVIKQVPDSKFLENLIFEYLTAKHEKSDLLFEWLEEIGDKDTAGRLSEELKKQNIKNSKQAEDTLEKLFK